MPRTSQRKTSFVSVFFFFSPFFLMYECCWDHGCQCGSVCRQKEYCIFVSSYHMENLNVCGLAAQNSSDCTSEFARIKIKILWFGRGFSDFSWFLLLARVLCDSKARIWVLSALRSPVGLPDPFAKVVVDGSGQCHSTDTVKSTLDPKWNQHYDLWVCWHIPYLFV